MAIVTITEELIRVILKTLDLLKNMNISKDIRDSNIENIGSYGIDSEIRIRKLLII